MNTEEIIVPTAQEFFNQKSEELRSDPEDMPEWMIDQAVEFAKLHVKKALAVAAERAYNSPTVDRDYYIEVRQTTILKAYPEENIK